MDKDDNTHLCAVLEGERTALGELHKIVVQQHLPDALWHWGRLPSQPAR